LAEPGWLEAERRRVSMGADGGDVGCESHGSPTSCVGSGTNGFRAGQMLRLVERAVGLHLAVRPP
jgi:hypothetical protein